MRINLLCFSALAAATLPACAQQSVTQPNRTDFAVQTKIVFSAPAVNLMAEPQQNSECPVAMRAERRSSGGTMQAREKTASSPVTEQRIHLEINSAQKAASEATVTVRGTRGAGRMIPADAASSVKASGAVQSFTLSPGKDRSAGMVSDLVLAGFTSVSSIRLDSISYVDGSSWTAAGGRSCVVQPDPLMRVSER